MRSLPSRVAGLALCMVLGPLPSAAQWMPGDVPFRSTGRSSLLWNDSGVGSSVGPEAPLARPASGDLLQQEDLRSAFRAAAFSALAPGSGQISLGQGRGWLYLGIEALAWLTFLDRREAGAAFRNRYRDLAWTEARIRSGPRREGEFEYYERMSQWTRSGAFDADPGQQGLQPETDPETYNGSIWARATAIFVPGGPDGPDDPRLAQALAYYGERAYGEAFLWDWTGTGPARDRFSGLIGSSDTRFRQATNVLGVILANHLVAVADAYLSGRSGSGLRPRMDAVPSRVGTVWTAGLEIPLRW